MHSPNGLPQSIIQRIVDYYCANESLRTKANYVARLATIQTLYQLSRVFRKCAKKYYYQILIFERNEAKQHQKYSWTTNLRSVINSGQIDSVEVLVIYSTKRFIEPKDILSQLKNAGFHKYKWTGIRTLRVFHQSSALDLKATDSWISDKSILALGKYLSTSLPSLAEINCDEPEVGDLYSRHSMNSLIKLTIESVSLLRIVEGNNPTFGVRQMPKQLTYLEIERCHNRGALLIPKIFAPSLKFLGLYGVPLSYFWDHFYNENGETLSFDSLVTLKLRFYKPQKPPTSSSDMDMKQVERGSEEDGAEDIGNQIQHLDDVESVYTILKQDRQRVRFPKLRILGIRSYPGGKLCEFLSDFPVERLVEFEAEGRLYSFKSINMRLFRSLQKFDLYIPYPVKRSEVPHLSRIWSKVLTMRSPLTRLTVIANWKPCLKLPSAIEFPYLKSLYLHCKMDIRQMCEMLKKLHSLEELVLFELPSVHKLPLTLDDIVDESSTIFENPSLAIRNPNFYVLDVEGVLRYQDHKLAVPVILLLSMYMPTLKNIKMDGFEEASSLMDSMLLELYIIMHQKHT